MAHAQVLLQYDDDGDASLNVDDFHRMVCYEKAWAEARVACNKYTTTLHAINSGIVKCSKLTRATKVFRGVGGMTLPRAFWQKNEFGVMGGCENAFMSTTVSREVATGYASGGGMGLVFEIQQGMVDRGASISWLSQYPHEKEILFGPLTGLEVQDTVIDNGCVIIRVRLSINLSARTIEQVVSKRRQVPSPHHVPHSPRVTRPVLARSHTTISPISRAAHRRDGWEHDPRAARLPRKAARQAPGRELHRHRRGADRRHAPPGHSSALAPLLSARGSDGSPHSLLEIVAR